MTIAKTSIDGLKKKAGSLFLALLVSACSSSGEKTVVSQGEFVKTIMLSAALQAERSQLFAAPLTDTWRIQIKWMVPEGQNVGAGEAVVRFDTANLSGEIEKCRLDLQTKTEEIKQKKADQDFKMKQLAVGVQTAEVERQKRAIDAAVPMEVITRYDYDQNQLNLKRADQDLAKKRREEQLECSDMQTQLAKMDLDRQDMMAKLDNFERQLERMTLKAEKGGAVVYGIDPYKERKVQPGDTVSATTVVAEIPEVSSLYVESWASESELRYLKQGQPVDLVLDAEPNKTWRGNIHDIVSKGERRRIWGAGNLFRVVIRMEDLDLGLMKPGMSVRCEIPVMRVPDAWLVPLDRVSLDGGAVWIKRSKDKVERIEFLGINEFHVALSPGCFKTGQEVKVFPLTEADLLRSSPVDSKGGI